MPPCLDIYGLAKDRSLFTLQRFLDRFVDRAVEEGREHALMIEAPNGDGDPVWEEGLSLAQVLQRGFDSPPQCFAVYLKSLPSVPIYRVIVQFTRDDRLVLGLSVDDPDDADGPVEAAAGWMAILHDDFGCSHGVMLTEQPPPRSLEEFVHWLAHPWCIDRFSPP